MTTVDDDLRTAFAGESQAYQKYMAFALQAERDGMPNIARLLRTTAEAERIHAEGHLRALGGVGSTTDNLQAAIDGELYEANSMYPPMLDRASEVGHKAARMFGYAVEAEAVHARLYSAALEAARGGADLAETRFYLCPVCGNIEFGAPPDRCTICNVPGSRFVEV